jgi:hypothetical protein
MTAEREMPLYQCHKQVRALKIAAVDHHPAGARITPADEGFGAIEVDAEYVIKHRPHGGGYYVVYEDGYKSFSPAAAFEGGYTRI